jgi:hypothetical protein
MSKAKFEAEAKKRKYKVLSYKLIENDEDEEKLGRGKIEKGYATIKKSRAKNPIKIEWEWRHTEYNYEIVARVGYNSFTIEECSYPSEDEIFITLDL